MFILVRALHVFRGIGLDVGLGVAACGCRGWVARSFWGCGIGRISGVSRIGGVDRASGDGGDGGDGGVVWWGWGG